MRRQLYRMPGAGDPSTRTGGCTTTRLAVRPGQAKADAMGGGGSGPAARGSIFFMNIDAQDKQDERLLHQNPARAVIRCGLADAQDYKLAVS